MNAIIEDSTLAHNISNTRTSFMKRSATPKTKTSKTLEPDKPKRALTAYNIFFREQRAEILSSQQGHSGGFATLARTIATRWKNITPEDHQMFLELAAKDKVRYQTEMSAWSEKKKATEQQGTGKVGSTCSSPSPLDDVECSSSRLSPRKLEIGTALSGARQDSFDDLSVVAQSGCSMSNGAPSVGGSSRWSFKPTTSHCTPLAFEEHTVDNSSSTTLVSLRQAFPPRAGRSARPTSSAKKGKYQYNSKSSSMHHSWQAAPQQLADEHHESSLSPIPLRHMRRLSGVSTSYGSSTPLLLRHLFEEDMFPQPEPEQSFFRDNSNNWDVSLSASNYGDDNVEGTETSDEHRLFATRKMSEPSTAHGGSYYYNSMGPCHSYTSI